MSILLIGSQPAAGGDPDPVEWHINTFSYDSKTLDHSGVVSAVRGFFLGPNDDSIWGLGLDHVLYRWTGTANDISTFTKHADEYDFTGDTIGTDVKQGIWFKPDGEYQPQDLRIHALYPVGYHHDVRCLKHVHVHGQDSFRYTVEG